MTRHILLIGFAALVWSGVAFAFMGCDDPLYFDYKLVDVALRKFYENTKGPTNWPPPYKVRWDSDMPCAWDGNERAHPAPAGTRCLNGGWHKFPPEADGGLQFIEHLSGTAEGPIPEEFKAFQMTSFVNLHGNKLNGPIWNTSYHCFMHRLDLSRNQMSGPLGDDFMQRNTIHAELINLGYNRFSGTIPARINTLAGLTVLLLNDNQFSGTIPDLSQCQNLRHLHLANNMLSGTIGAWMKEMRALAWVELDGNQFEGALPELPPKVSRFIGANNKFIGKIPESYGRLPQLRHFNCTGCNIECPDPNLLAHLPFTTHCKGTKRKWEA